MGIYLNSDCMDPLVGLPSFGDNHFDWCVADPSYGVGEHGGKKRSGWALQKNGTRLYVKDGAYEKKDWDSEACDPRILDEIVRVSRNQIIWGINYMKWVPPSGGRIVWDKCNDGSDQSDCEIAYCSAHDTVRMFRFMWSGFCQGSSAKSGTVQKGNKKLNQSRIHPCEKPFEFYRWAAGRYFSPGAKVLDPFVGSAASLQVYEELGFDYVGYELDADYYRDSCKRLEAFRSSPRLFTGAEIFEASKPMTLF